MNEKLSEWRPRYCVTVHNCSEQVNAIFGPFVPGDPDEHWDMHTISVFSDIPDAVKEVDRLHQQFLPLMEELPKELGDLEPSWFSVEMEVRPGLYTMIYWPGRSASMAEIETCAADSWIAVHSISGDITRH